MAEMMAQCVTKINEERAAMKREAEAWKQEQEKRRPNKGERMSMMMPIIPPFFKRDIPTQIQSEV